VYRLISAYLLLIPTTFHPWYVIWLLPCLCFYPSWGWLYFSGAIALSYLAYTQDYPEVSNGIYLLEFLPLYLLLLAQAVWRRWQSPVLRTANCVSGCIGMGSPTRPVGPRVSTNGSFGAPLPCRSDTSLPPAEAGAEARCSRADGATRMIQRLF